MDLTLSTPRGQVALRLTPDATAPPASNGAARLRYRIQGGTGAFDGRAGQGEALFKVIPNMRQHGLRGRVVLTLRADRAVA